MLFPVWCVSQGIEGYTLSVECSILNAPFYMAFLTMAFAVKDIWGRGGEWVSK